MVPKGIADVSSFSGCSGVDLDGQHLCASESAGGMVGIAISLTYAGSDTPGTGFCARLRHFAGAKISPSWKGFNLIYL